MQISLMLFIQIVKLFLMIFMGYLLVRVKVLKISDASVLSVITLYLIVPCLILSAFQIERTPERTRGLLMAYAAAVFINFVLLFLGRVCAKIFRLSPVEQASAIYPNAGNMIVPIITSLLGKDMVIYACAFMTVQILFFWTHLRSLLCGETKPDWKKILTNINIIAVAAGILFYFFQFRIPSVVGDALSSVGSMIGPMSMIITGMLIAGADLRKIFSTPRAYFVSFLRLILFPLCTLPFVVLFAKGSGLKEANMILLITYLAAMAPCASTTTQMAQIFHKDAEYAGVLNVMSVIFCIVTMPLLIGLYSFILPV